MANRIQLRRGDSSEWSNANPTLAQGEIGIELNTRRFKIGDGATPWNLLGYVTPEIAVDNSPNTLVQRDADGNFEAGVITGSLIGNAASATRLANTRLVTLIGDSVGSGTFDGSANLTISTKFGLVTTLPHYNPANESATGTYTKVTVDSGGRVINASNPTTIQGYGLDGTVEGQSAQPFDRDLRAIAENTNTGIYAKTADGALSPRTVTGTGGRISVVNGSGVAGDPTLDLINTTVVAGDYNVESLTSVGTGSQTVNTTKFSVDQWGRLTAALTVPIATAVAGTTASAWSVATAYVRGDKVTNASKLYQAVATVTGGGAPTHSSGTTGAWEYIAASATLQKGLASFDQEDFGVTAGGHVTIATGGVDNSQLQNSRLTFTDGTTSTNYDLDQINTYSGLRTISELKVSSGGNRMFEVGGTNTKMSVDTPSEFSQNITFIKSGGLTVGSAENITLSLAGNNAASRTLAITSTNSGAGSALLNITADEEIAITSTNSYVTVESIRFAGNVLSASGDIILDPNQDNSTAGTLTLKGALQVDAAATVTGVFNATNDVIVNTNKFSITAATGNTSIAGTLGVTNLATFNNGVTIAGSTTAATEYFRITDGNGSPVTKFLVDTASGDTTIQGSITVNSNTTLGDAFADTLTVNATSTFNSSVTLSAAKDLTVGGNLIVTGNTTLNGATGTINATTLTVDDPIITLNGDTAPVSNDSKDRGVEFRYYDTQARLGFFGWDTSASKYVFLTGVTNTSEVVSGTDAGLQAGNLTLTGTGTALTVNNNATITGTLGVTSTTTLTGSLTANGGIQVNGTAGVTGITSITNNTAANTVSATYTAAGALQVTGGVSIGAGLAVGGDVQVYGSIEVTGAQTYSGSAAFKGNVIAGTILPKNADGNADTDVALRSYGGLVVDQRSVFTGNVYVNPTSGLTSPKFFIDAATGNTTVAGTLGVTSTTTLTGALIANGNSTLGDASADTLTVNATSTFNAPVTLSGATTNLSVGGNITVTGNLTVNGTTTTVNSTTISVADKNIELGTVASPTDVTSDGGGITLRGTTDKTILYTNSTTSWDFNQQVNIVNTKGLSIANSQVITSARALTNITGITTSGQLTSTVATGTAPFVVASTTRVNNLNANFHNGLDTATANTVSTVVARDASGNFSAGTITAALTGNASTASTWQTARTINLSGDLSGSVSINGGADVTLSASIVDTDLTALRDLSTTGIIVRTGAGTATTRQVDVSAGSGLTVTNATGVAGNITLGTNATSSNTASTLVLRDASGNFTAGTITATLSGTATNATNINISSIDGNTSDTTTSVVLVGSAATGNQSPFIDAGLTYNASTNALTATTFIGALTGNSDSATILQTGRNFSITGDVTASAISFNGSGNVALATTLAAGVVSNTNISATAAIAVSKLAANTISGVTLGNNLNTLTFGTYLTGTSYNGSSGVTIGTNATSSNTASTLVARDASGNFTAGTITAALTGNASTATTLQTTRNIAVSGDVTGTTTFNGGADATISTTLANSGVTVGTYTKVTVDAKGRATSGTTLSASDIPNVTLSKISDYISDMQNKMSSIYDQFEALLSNLDSTTGMKINITAIGAKANSSISGPVSTISLGSGGSGYTTVPNVTFSGGGGGINAQATASITTYVSTIVVSGGGGSGYTVAPSVGFNSGGGSGLQATAVLSSTGAVKSVSVSSGGSGYTSSPSVGFTIGTSATATANLATSGAVKSISVASGGSGYAANQAALPVSFAGGGGGGGAVATAATNASGVITAITVTSGGSGYTVAPTLTVTGGSVQPTTTVTLGYAIASVTVNTGGSGYTNATQVSFSGNGSGTIAAATVGYAVSSITVNNGGSGWTSAPNITFSGNGSGAAANATIDGYVSGLTLNAGGSGYTSAPIPQFSGSTGGGATGSTTINMGVTGYSITAGGSGYTSAPIVQFNGGGGSNAQATAVISGGVVTGLVISNAGSGYTSAPTVAFSGGGGTGTFTNGSTVTGSTSGATATIVAYDSVNTPAVVSVNAINGVFLRGETLTSGATNYPISSTNAFDAV
jgi:hypothetical protein